MIPDDASVADSDNKPVTVRSLVRELFNDQLDAKLLDGLASSLQQHIMPSSDLIVVTLFFIEHILPHLGAAPAWMLTLLRDQCFADSESGEMRTQVTVKGGYREIAGWLGMSRAKTIWEWLNEKYPGSHKESGKFTNAVLRVYLAETEKNVIQLDFEGQPRTFNVLLQEVPQEIIYTAVTLPEGNELAQWRDFQYRSGAIFSIGMARFSDMDGAIFSIAMARFSVMVGALFTVLSLKHLKDSSLNSSATVVNIVSDECSCNVGHGENGDAGPGTKKSAAVVVLESWDLQKLLQINNVHPKTQAALHNAKVTAHVFVANLLFAFSKQNDKIKSPLSFALAQVRANPNPPDEKFASLAAMPAETLVAFLTGDVPSGHPLVTTWRKQMGSENGKTPRYRKLLPILLGDDAPQPKQVAHSDPIDNFKDFTPRKG